jgi:hypothetical protein
MRARSRLEAVIGEDRFDGRAYLGLPSLLRSASLPAGVAAMESWLYLLAPPLGANSPADAAKHGWRLFPGFATVW